MSRPQRKFSPARLHRPHLRLPQKIKRVNLYE
jgi:hypothetical protein